MQRSEESSKNQTLSRQTCDAAGESKTRCLVPHSHDANLLQARPADGDSHPEAPPQLALPFPRSQRCKAIGEAAPGCMRCWLGANDPATSKTSKGQHYGQLAA